MLRVYSEKLGADTILHFQGRIVNGEATSTLRDAVVSQTGASAVVIELSGVDVIDAAGLGVLVELREWAQSKGIRFKLANVAGGLRQVFQITRLDSVFEISSPHSDNAESRWRQTSNLVAEPWKWVVESH